MARTHQKTSIPLPVDFPTIRKRHSLKLFQVRRMVKEIAPSYKFSLKALALLQKASDEHLRDVFKDSQESLDLEGGTVLFPKQMKLAHRFRMSRSQYES